MTKGATARDQRWQNTDIVMNCGLRKGVVAGGDTVGLVPGRLSRVAEGKRKQVNLQGGEAVQDLK